MITLSVDADISGETDLLGKSVTDLQEDITVSDDAITGTLKFATGYTGFSGDENLQSGNYIVLHAEADQGAVISAEVIGGYFGPVTLDTDGILIARIESTSQSIRFVGMKAGKITAVKTLSLSDVTLTPETPTVDLAEADTNDDGTYSEAELKALTKAQLLELADALLVEGVSSSNTKAEIIAAILAAQENQGG